MLSEFIIKKLEGAKYKLLKDGSYFGEIPGLRGVWASDRNLETCRKELQEVLEDWLMLKIAAGEKIPGFVFRPIKRLLAKYA